MGGREAWEPDMVPRTAVHFIASRSAAVAALNEPPALAYSCDHRSLCTDPLPLLWFLTRRRWSPLRLAERARLQRSSTHIRERCSTR
jgi:hypothetical protein